MIKYLNIHRNYLFNKINVRVILLLEIVALIISFSGIYSINEEFSWFDRVTALNNYLETVTTYFKLVIIMICCYIWGSSFTKERDNYHLLINNFHEKKIQYVLSKIIVLIIISFITIYLLVFGCSIMGVICSNWYEIDKKIIILYLSYFFIVIIYGNLSIIFSLIITSDYAYFISVGIFVFCEIVKESMTEGLTFNLIQIFFPTIISVNGMITKYGLVHLIFLSLLYVMITILVYFKKGSIK